MTSLMLPGPRAGFSLLELMITVAIVGVLAAVAVPTFSGYVKKSRVTEGTIFLASIKNAQDSYRSEFGQYCAVDGATFPTSRTTFNPASAPSIEPTAWTNDASWDQLGASPDGPVRFRYATVAGFPGSAVPAGSGLDNNDFWFAARAIGDLDGDATDMTLNIYSQSNIVYNSKSGSGDWE